MTFYFQNKKYQLRFEYPAPGHTIAILEEQGMSLDSAQTFKHPKDRENRECARRAVMAKLYASVAHFDKPLAGATMQVYYNRFLYQFPVTILGKMKRTKWDVGYGIMNALMLLKTQVVG